MKSISLILATILFAATLPLLSSTQEITVSGTVTYSDNTPIPGAMVTVKDTLHGTITDANGIFTITVKKGDVLIFSFLGCETREMVVNGPIMNVKLKDSVLDPDQEIVFGPPSQLEIPERPVVITESPVMVDSDMKINTVIEFAEYSEEAVLMVSPYRRRTTVTGSLQGKTSGIQASEGHYMMRGSEVPDMYYPGGEEYGQFRENRFVMVGNDPLSTFSLDVDGASYSNVRRMLNSGQRPPADAIRVEEMINYFSYDYPQPTGQHPVNIDYEVGQCPWNTQHKLVRIGVKAKEIPSADLAPTNFVFLIDVSGSMAGRIELVKSSFKLLVNNLRPTDKVAIVVYASEVGIKLPATSGSDKQTINDAINALRAGGSTAGGAGIQTAYRVARENFIEGDNNRIILATDGDFNVGVSSPQELERLIERERQSGIFLTVLGYGMGNYKDNRIQVLAEKGNGNHAYIDNLQEAHKVLVEEFGGTMHTVAKDVKLQVEFNPSQVQAYRLVGYESRMLEHRDFNDDTKDAGELGVGHTVTALYEIVPVGVSRNAVDSVDPLRYEQQYFLRGNQIISSPVRKVYIPSMEELMYIKLRYKYPDGEQSKLMVVPVIENRNAQSGDFYFASAVAMFGQLLKDSEFKGDADYDLVVSTARRGLGNDEHGYRREFIRLAESAKGLANN